MNVIKNGYKYFYFGRPGIQCDIATDISESFHEAVKEVEHVDVPLDYDGQTQFFIVYVPLAKRST